MATYEDVSERRHADARIRFMARHDALTIRVLFHDRMEELLRSTGRRGESLAALLAAA